MVLIILFFSQDKFHSIIRDTTKELLISSFSLDFSSAEISGLITDKLENNVSIKVLIAEVPSKRNADFWGLVFRTIKNFGDNFELIIHQNRSSPILSILSYTVICITYNICIAVLVQIYVAQLQQVLVRPFLILQS